MKAEKGQGYMEIDTIVEAVVDVVVNDQTEDVDADVASNTEGAILLHAWKLRSY